MGFMFRLAAISATMITGLCTTAVAASASPVRPAVSITSWSARYHGDGSFNQPTAMAVSPDGATVFVTGMTNRGGTHNCGTVAYDTATGAVRWQAIYPNDEPNALALSPDGSAVYIATDSGTIAYNAGTGAQLWANAGEKGDSIAISPDGSTLYVSGAIYGGPHSWEYATSAYNAATGTNLWTSIYDKTETSLGDRIELSPDGATLFLSGWAGNGFTTVAYQTSTGAVAWERLWRSRPSGQATPTALAVSPDGSKVFVTGLDNRLGVSQDIYATLAYDAGTGTRLWVRLHPENGSVVATSVAVSLNGSAVYVTGLGATPTGHEDYSTLSYDAATGAVLWTQRYTGPAGSNGGAAFAGLSPDGSTLFVTGQGYGGYTTLGYDAATGAQEWVRNYVPPEGAAITAAAVNPVTAQVFATGTSRGKTNSNQQYATVAYSVAG